MRKELVDEVLEKSKAFHERIESSDNLINIFLDSDCHEWHEFRDVMIRLSILKPGTNNEQPIELQKGDDE